MKSDTRLNCRFICNYYICLKVKIKHDKFLKKYNDFVITKQKPNYKTKKLDPFKSNIFNAKNSSYHK